MVAAQRAWQLLLLAAPLCVVSTEEDPEELCALTSMLPKEVRQHTVQLPPPGSWVGSSGSSEALFWDVWRALLARGLALHGAVARRTSCGRVRPAGGWKRRGNQLQCLHPPHPQLTTPAPAPRVRSRAT